jgi:FdhE protein
MTQGRWLPTHPYLQPMADLQGMIDASLDQLLIPSANIPTWDDYARDFHAGVPLLQSSTVAIDLRPIETIIIPLLETLASKPLPGKLAENSRDLCTELRADSDLPRRAVNWLLDQDSFAPAHPGPLRYIGWSTLARYLCRLVEAFDRWRDEEQWLRNYCPTCGSLPAMAQLLGVDPGRLRFLSCGCCGTRWRYRRTGCPFCENEDDHRLSVLAIEEENYLRIDYCERCGGYLKTYNGTGSEGLLLADWTSLHLDIIAQDRGLNRYAGSLYQL